MRYELADYEWIAIKPVLPNKPRSVPRVNDHRVLSGVFWVCALEHLGVICPKCVVHTPHATTASSVGGGLVCRIIDALSAAQDTAVQMIDTSIVRVHQHGACIAGNRANRWKGSTKRRESYVVEQVVRIFYAHRTFHLKGLSPLKHGVRN